MIKIDLLEPRILKYKVYDEENYATCYFTLDLDNYELSVSGECQASYQWSITPQESFLDLMLRCGEDYLCNKLGYCMEKEFDFDKSVEKTVEKVKRYFVEQEEDGEEIPPEFRDRVIILIKNIDECGEEMFWYEAESIISRYLNKTSYPEDYISLVKEYPYWLTRSVKYFCENVKPALEEYKKSHKI